MSSGGPDRRVCCPEGGAEGVKVELVKWGAGVREESAGTQRLTACSLAEQRPAQRQVGPG